MSYYCYILKNGTNGRTYNGSTNSLKRRIRQHNGEIVGGAKATSEGRPWEYCALLTGFDTHVEALSCEWRIKHPTNTKKRPLKYCGVEGRIQSLNHLMTLDTWTSKSTGLENNQPYVLYVDESYVHLLTPDKFKSNVEIKVMGENDEIVSIRSK